MTIDPTALRKQASTLETLGLYGGVDSLRRAADEIYRLRVLLDSLAKRHEWSEHFESGCVCEWHKKWRELS